MTRSVPRRASLPALRLTLLQLVPFTPALVAPAEAQRAWNAVILVFNTSNGDGVGGPEMAALAREALAALRR